MNNILPTFKTFSLEEKDKSTQFKSWKPSDAIASRKELPRYLDEPKPRRKLSEKEQIPRSAGPPPNHKYTMSSPYSLADPSPLCTSERGIPDEAKAIIPRKLLPKKIRVPSVDDKRLILTVCNMVQEPMSCFVQRPGKMSSHTVDYGDHKSIVIGGEKNTADVINMEPDVNTLCVQFSSTCRLLLATTGKQDCRDFVFGDGPIGLEVEMIQHRLACTKILPNSPAAQYGNLLVAGEIVAVNGQRVLSLEEFQSCVMSAKSMVGRVVLTIAVYRDGKGQLDDLYQHEFKKDVKSILSNLLKVGIDSDHQHGIELPSAARDDDDGIENSDGENSEASASSQPRNVSTEDNGTDLVRRSSKRLSSRKVSMQGKPSVSKSDSFSRRSGPLSSVDSDEERNEDSTVDSSGGSDSDSSEESMEVEKRKLRDFKRRVSREAIEDEVKLIRKIEEQKAEGGLDRGDTDDTLSTQGEQKNGGNPLIGEVQTITRVAESKLGMDEDCTLQAQISVHRRQDTLEEVQQEDFGAKEMEFEEVKSEHVLNKQLSMASFQQASISTTSDEAEEDIGWDYATALANAEAVPFSRLVCVAPFIAKSQRWGNPTKYFQISNFSRFWDIELFWVDEDSALISRKMISSGENHVELTSFEHVWVIVVSANQAAIKKCAHLGIKDGFDAKEEKKNISSISMILKPSKTSLVHERCVTLIWVPWNSLSTCQRLHPPKVAPHLVKPELKDRTDHLQPHLHVQVLDISTKELMRQHGIEESSQASSLSGLK